VMLPKLFPFLLFPVLLVPLSVLNPFKNTLLVPVSVLPSLYLYY
jgi:hypothetical protein